MTAFHLRVCSLSLSLADGVCSFRAAGGLRCSVRLIDGLGSQLARMCRLSRRCQILSERSDRTDRTAATAATAATADGTERRQQGHTGQRREGKQQTRSQGCKRSSWAEEGRQEEWRMNTPPGLTFFLSVCVSLLLCAEFCYAYPRMYESVFQYQPPMDAKGYGLGADAGQTASKAEAKEETRDGSRGLSILASLSLSLSLFCPLSISAQATTSTALRLVTRT